MLCCSPKHSFGCDLALAAIAGFGVLIGAAQPAAAQFVQQGPKLVGSGAIGAAKQGSSVALSADGNTAVVGGPDDNPNAPLIGATWVFVRSGGKWIQQGPKLVAISDATTNAQQGFSVGVSGDGNTAIVGGPGDNSDAGAAWTFTRGGGSWGEHDVLLGSNPVGYAQQGASVALSADGSTAIVGGDIDNSGAGAAWVFFHQFIAGQGYFWIQQGKLVGSSAVENALQGYSVALSGDGNTAIVGGPLDNGYLGAAWVFTRSGGTWTQQAKLVAEDADALAEQGWSVALSADGNTALVGGYGGAGGGAAWVFTRNSSAVWKEQAKLVGSGAAAGANPEQGWSAALTADGNTAVVGGPNDNQGTGAAWVFTRNGAGRWTQYGSKLIGSGGSSIAFQGCSVAVSGDGASLMVGGCDDNNEVGAVWVFVRPTAHDFNGQHESDIAWRDTSGNTALWLMNGATVASSAVVANVPTAWSIVGQRDFDGDGKADLLWYDSGNVAIWLMNGTAVTAAATLGNVGGWTVAGTGDFNGDGMGDIVWYSGGNVAMWLMNGTQIASVAVLGNVGTNWSVVGTGDFDGDGKTDILWRDTAGNLAIWFMNGASVTSVASLGNVAPAWSVAGTGDFDGDGRADILWYDSGTVAIWLMNGAAVTANASLGNVAGWTVAQTGDYNGDRRSDILWYNGGAVALWFMDGAAVASTASLGSIPTAWTIQGANAD